MWLGEPTLAMASVVLVHSWRLIPFSTVIMLAGRTSIPKEIPEAAAIDGAGFWRTDSYQYSDDDADHQRRRVCSERFSRSRI